MKVYTYRVKHGEFKGKILKSYEDRHHVIGVTGPWILCFDENWKEYIIFYNELEDVKEN